MRDQPAITRIFGADGDQDGFDEEYVELYYGDLAPLVAGESYKSVELKLIYDPSETTADSAYTSLTNATVSTTAYGYTTSTGYESGLDEGDAVKIAKIQISISTDGTNETYPDLEYWKFVSFALGPYTWGTADFGPYDLANARYQITFGDQINHQDGKILYMPKNAATLWCPYELKAYTKFPAANVFTVTVNIFMYEEDGTMSAAEAITCLYTAT